MTVDYKTFIIRMLFYTLLRDSLTFLLKLSSKPGAINIIIVLPTLTQSYFFSNLAKTCNLLYLTSVHSSSYNNPHSDKPVTPHTFSLTTKTVSLTLQVHIWPGV